MAGRGIGRVTVFLIGYSIVLDQIEVDVAISSLQRCLAADQVKYQRVNPTKE